MAKSVLKKVFLIMLPALAVLLAAAVDSVTVMDAGTGIAEAYSYFDLIPGTSFWMCPPLAAILAVVSLVLAVCVAAGKNRCAMPLVWTGLLSAALAALPIVIRGDILVIPNVGLPILMLIECLIANAAHKNPESEQKKTVAPQLRRN